MEPHVEQNLLRHIAEHLADLGLDWEIRREEPPHKPGRPDALVTIRHDQGQLLLAAEIKAGAARAHLGALLAELRQHDHRRADDRKPLLLTDHVNPPLANRLRDEGIFFLDAAGNAFLRDAGLHIWVTGNRDTLRIRAARERRRAFQPSGLKIVFALLCKPRLAEEGYRTIAEAAGAALGTVQWVMRDLIDEGYVMKLGRFERRLVKPAELLDAWTPAYARDLRPKLLLARFEAPAGLEWKRIDLHEHGALWGGEPAAAEYTGFLKPENLTIYADQIPVRLVAELHLKKRDTGPFEVRRRFWTFEDEGPGEAVRRPVAPPILVYADLLALGEARAREAAHRLRHEHIDRRFEAHLARWNR